MSSPNRIGFLQDIDFTTFALGETENANSAVSEVIRPAQMAVTGEYVSRRYGKFKITEGDIDAMIANFRMHHPVSPTELSVDYDHNEGKAAGWIKKLWKTAKTVAGKRVVELWGDVAWTKPAAQAIHNKEYRFFSPMFEKDYQTPTGRKIGPCLLGGGITNRPFLQGMTAVSLSARDEDVALPVSGQSGVSNMTLITVKDKDGNDVQVDLDALKGHDEIKKLSAPAATKTDATTTLDPNVAALASGMKQMHDTVIKLSETIADRDKRDRKADAERKIDAAIASGRIAPADKDIYMLAADSDAGMTKINALDKAPVRFKMRADKAGKTVTVSVGDPTDPDAVDADPDANIDPDKAEEIMLSAIAEAKSKNAKLTDVEAMNQVARARPGLAKAFQLSFREA